MRISDWSSDVCSSDLVGAEQRQRLDVDNGEVDVEEDLDRPVGDVEPPHVEERHQGIRSIWPGSTSRQQEQSFRQTTSRSRSTASCLHVPKEPSQVPAVPQAPASSAPPPSTHPSCPGPPSVAAFPPA